MANLTAPKGQVPIGRVMVAGQQYEVSVHPEWLRYLTSDLFNRVGGTTGPSTADLSTAQFEDAGIEELRIDSYRLLDEIRQLPTTIAQVQDDAQAPIYETAVQQDAPHARIEALEAQVAVLMQEIDGLKQGYQL